MNRMANSLRPLLGGWALSAGLLAFSCPVLGDQLHAERVVVVLQGLGHIRDPGVYVAQSHDAHGYFPLSIVDFLAAAARLNHLPQQQGGKAND